IAAGKGGDGPAGGDGGDLALLSLSLLSIDGGQATAGAGGAGQPPGANGALSLGAAAIWENGATRVNGDGFAFSVLAPARVRGIAGGTALAPFFFLNRGLNPDTYHFFWSNSAGWPVTGLPASVKVSNLRFGLVLASLPIPAGVSDGTTSTLRLTARSQGQPALSVERSVQIVVGGGGRLFLPSLLLNQSPAQAAGHTQLTPAVEPLQDAPLPAGDSRLYLPVIGNTPPIGD
ncbi:MAG TPA: hypothetical protein VNK95_00445, partial [Caldilineaceae bacterium]|nr:hypothetical protein [Caldilineaceae bacterium]